MIQDTNEQPDEEVHRTRSGRIPRAGASISMELGYVTLPVWMYSPTRKLSESHIIGTFMEASLPVLLPSQESGGQGWKF